MTEDSAKRTGVISEEALCHLQNTRPEHVDAIYISLTGFPLAQSLADAFRRFTDPETWQYCPTAPKFLLHDNLDESGTIIQLHGVARAEAGSAGVITEFVTLKGSSRYSCRHYRCSAMGIYLPKDGGNPSVLIHTEDNRRTPGESLINIALPRRSSIYRMNEPQALQDEVWILNLRRFLTQSALEISSF